jgi:HAE1 family hydrophobic/amphiphilic exporter-1
MGFIAIQKLTVDNFPHVNFPMLFIETEYPGADPEAVEVNITKKMEEAFSNISGIKHTRSESINGRSKIVMEFNEDEDIHYAEQQVREKISEIKGQLPKDVNTYINRVDVADQPILILSVKSNLSNAVVYELADKKIKPEFSRLPKIGKVDIDGGSKREIHVDLDRDKLSAYDLSASKIANSISTFGKNIPIGKIDKNEIEKFFRTSSEYRTIQDISNIPVNFGGNEIPVTLKDLGTVTDTTEDESSKTYVDGQPGIVMEIFRQVDSNTIAVVNTLDKKIKEMNKRFKNSKIPIELKVVYDGSKVIHKNVEDVVESILVGILLTIVVVYCFLGSGRSTFITGLALPSSLLGAFFLMYLAGFSINTMSLLALSLSVGLLVDDAIVVRENIFRHTELGKNPIESAVVGTKEVVLAVLATSLTTVAIFGPIGFLQGIVGSFFKEFGLTICFAILISLIDSITVAPMLSAHIGMKSKNASKNKIILKLNAWQDKLEDRYAKILEIVLHYPLSILGGALLIFICSFFLLHFVPKTFISSPDNGEFLVSVELPLGSNLSAMDALAKKIDNIIRANKEVESSVSIVGSKVEPNQTSFFIGLVPRNKRSISTNDFKERIRNELKSFQTAAKIVVRDIDIMGGGERPFHVTITGDNSHELKQIAERAYEFINKDRLLLDPELSIKPGKPELQIVPNQLMTQKLGVATTTLGDELHTLVEGSKPAVYRENGENYNILVRLKDDQRNIEETFDKILVPNMNNSLVPLHEVASIVSTQSLSSIKRKDRQQYIQISGDIDNNGPGMAKVMQNIDLIFKTKIILPEGINYHFSGQAERFSELGTNMMIALCLGIIFIYLVLASLYESFVIPFTIMLVLPLAASGAFLALFITRHALDLFSMIGCILLFGIATKNSILLVDYTRQLIRQGHTRKEALIAAGRVRLRPILMTSMALIAGMIPVAIGLNEASSQRTGMGIAVIGGILSSTLLTLVVVPAAYGYFERFSHWSSHRLKRFIKTQ